MLERLDVRGLGIIERVDIVVPPGFSVLTGETGAGKSLLVGSLDLIAGGRASADAVRSGEPKLVVQAWFAPPLPGEVDVILEDLGIEFDGDIVIRREVGDSGRSRCWVNDTIVTVGGLQRIAGRLLAIHGQHEQHGLSDTRVQRKLVDDFGRLESELTAVREAWDRWSRAAADVNRLEAARNRRRDRLDVIAFQEAEIDGVAPVAGEDEELRQRRTRLRNAVRLRTLVAEITSTLGDREGSIVEELARTSRAIGELGECGVDTSGMAPLIAEAQLLSEEVLREVRAQGTDVENDPGELEELESRLHRLESLTLKYGGTLQNVLEHRRGLAEERKELENVEEHLDQARAEAQAALEAYDRAARVLHERRVEASRVMEGEITAVLERLDMTGATLKFRWSARPDTGSPLIRDGSPAAFDEDGVEEAELFLAANRGEPLRPMARIASGGELSRIHLAIRTVLRRRAPAGGLTLLFDEVDSGLGGRAAAALAELLADLARDDQVLVVTHLAQVAGRAEAQFRVEKKTHAGRTTTTVSRLSQPQRVDEISRMVAGDAVTDAARAHAVELLANASPER